MYIESYSSTSSVSSYSTITSDDSSSTTTDSTTSSSTSSTTSTSDSYYSTMLDGYNSKADAAGQMLDKIKELEEIMSNLSDMNYLIPTEATSSNSSAVSVTATSDATLGSFSISVEQLASVGMAANTQFLDSKDSIIGQEGETFTYQYGDGEEITFDISGMTAQELVDTINKQDSGVVASLISTADGVVFQMQGTETGSANALSVSTTSSAMGEWQTKDAQDAIYTLNGFTDMKYTSSSNSLEDVIAGVNMDLKNITDGEVVIEVSQNTDDLFSKVEEYVDAVNSIRELAKELSISTNGSYVFGSTADNSGTPLSGSMELQMFMSEFNSIVSSSVGGLTADNSDYAHLGHIGITTGTDGYLQIDETLLKQALENDPQAVANLFATDEIIVESENFTMASDLGTAKAGEYSVEYSTDENGKITSVLIDGKEATYDEESGRYTLMDSESDAYGLSIKFHATLDANTTYSDDTISVTQGKASELSDFLSTQSGVTSMFSGLQSSYTTMASNLTGSTVYSSSIGSSSSSSSSSTDSSDSSSSSYSSWDQQVAMYSSLNNLLSSLASQMVSGTFNSDSSSSSTLWGDNNLLSTMITTQMSTINSLFTSYYGLQSS